MARASWGQCMAGMSGGTPQKNVVEYLEYIGSILAELQPMASSNGLPVLAHLLEMARIEAADQIALQKAESAGEGGIKRLRA